MAFYYHKLRALRKAKGLSQAELAQQLGLGKSTIAMYECGKRTPEFETIEAICDFFNVNMSDLSDSKLAIRLSDLVSSVCPKDLDTLFKPNTNFIYGSLSYCISSFVQPVQIVLFRKINLKLFWKTLDILKVLNT